MVPAPPRTTQENIEDVYGEMGRLWLTLLPETLERICDLWQIKIDAFLGGNYAVVYLVRDRDNELLVLKLGVPSREVEREWRTLRAFGGNGCVALRELDEAGTALLLDRVSPGRSARELPDDEAMPLAADIIKLLHDAPPDPVLPDVTELAAGFTRLRQAHDGGTGPLDRALVEAAEASFEAVLPDRPRVLLHGDLHHGNLLSTKGGWTSIDPHGVRGPAEWEAGALLRNPWEDLRSEAHVAARLDKRVDLLCDCMDWDVQTVRRLAAAQAVLSAVWSWEDHGVADPLALRVAAALWR